MTLPIKIQVAELIDSPFGISAEDGQKVFSKVEQLLKNSQQVIISFEKITLLVSIFLNVVVGQLYNSLSEEVIHQHLKIEGLSPDDSLLLKHVVDNAKKYYANKQAYDAAWQEEEACEE